MLTGQSPKLDLTQAVEITRSLPHGQVAAVLGSAQRLGMAEPIDPTPSRNRDLVLAMLAAQVIAPGSKLATARGCAPRPPPAHWARCWVWPAVMRTTSMRRWTGCWPARPPSKRPWLHGIWPTARWCSMTCPRRRCRAAAAAGRDRACPRRGQRPVADRLRAAVLPERGAGGH